MSNWQDTIIQALIGLVLYLIGIRSIREGLRRTIRKKWGDIVLQLLVFTLLVLAFLFFQVPALASFTLIGVILAALTVTSLSSLMQEYATLGSDVAEWFGEEAREILRYLPPDRSINQRVLRRAASILRSRGHVLTTKLQGVVEFRQCLDEGFWVYETRNLVSYKLQSSVRATLVYEVRLAPVPTIPYDWNYPPLPLEYHEPSDKWHVSYWLPIKIDRFDFWKQWMEQIAVEGWLSGQDGREKEKVDFEREIIQSKAMIGSHEIELKYLRFTADVVLHPNTPILSVHTKGLLHPMEIPSMYFYAWDLCTESWEFQVSTDQLADSLQVISIMPLSGLGDVAISSLQIRPGFARMRMEALPGSAIVPQDGVLIRFGSADQVQGNL